MKTLRTIVLPVFLATAWVAVSEFVRNQLLFRSYWVDHYAGIGLVFPSAPPNGAIWGVWSLGFSIAVYAITRKYRALAAMALSWLVGFVLMWLVIGNLGVLPYRLLPFAVPLSILESVVAVLIINATAPRTAPRA